MTGNERESVMPNHIMIPVKEIQRFLKRYGYDARIDGIIGPRTLRAARQALDIEMNWDVWKRWGEQRIIVAVQQILMEKDGAEVGMIDGLIGPQTRYGLEQWHGLVRDKPLDITNEIIDAKWPHERNVPEFYGRMNAHQVRLKLPYTMKLAWNKRQKIKSFYIHEKCHDSASRVFHKVLDHYGPDRIRKLRLDIFSGCLTKPRRKRGGSSWSMHSWGIAIDFDNERNRLHWGADRAALARPEYEKFWEFWEEEGWVSLGRERNFDWMHVQAAKI